MKQARTIKRTADDCCKGKTDSQPTTAAFWFDVTVQLPEKKQLLSILKSDGSKIVLSF